MERMHSHVFIRDIPSFDSFSCPGSFAEKGKTGFHAGIVEEATDRDSASHLSPTISRDEVFDDGFQRNSVQGIAGMGNGHECITYGVSVLVSVRNNRGSVVILHDQGAAGL